ncbi:hypothetical protein HD806DRAFT_521900 [Xylariaceae sp. AK1471]|nr:hypothetical protein HD806DRAFT_521900 [Xylariaceae sp. AK1471]
MARSEAPFSLDQPGPFWTLNNTSNSEAIYNKTVTGTPNSVPEVSFHKFMRLPSEVRVLVYEHAAFEAMNSVYTIGIHQSHQEHRETFVVQTQREKPYVGKLPQVCRESKGEVERLCVDLPTRLVTDIGANIVNINQGQHLRPMSSSYLGDWPYHYEATFFMDEWTAIETFNLLNTNRITTGKLSWLRNLMLDRRTFQHMLCGYHSFARSRPGAPFTELPSLRTIVVGFVYRWQDVATVEGRYDDVVTEVKVRRTQGEEEDEEEQWALSCISRDLHPMIELMIVSTVRQTSKEVADLETAGIEVVWGVIRKGITRRPDIFEWFLGP